MSLGTLAINNNSDQVAGTNTSFTVDLKVNDFIAVPSGGVTYTMVVKAIASDTALTITRPFSGPNVTGANWAAIPAGTMVGVTAKIADDTAYTMRMYVNEANNWMSLLTIDGDVTVYAPDGSDYTGPSWLKLSRIMGTLDMPALTTIAAQIHADAVQVASDTQTTAANTATATQAAQTATTAAQSASQAAQTATTKAGEASASAVTAKNEADRAATANPDNQLKKANNLSDLPDKNAARQQLRVQGIECNDGTGAGDYNGFNSPDGTYQLRLANNGEWRYAKASDNSTVPLPVYYGGTGGLMNAQGEFTTIASPDKSKQLFIRNDGSWGTVIPGGAAVALGIDYGGTSGLLNLSADSSALFIDNPLGGISFFVENNIPNKAKLWGAYDKTTFQYIPLAMAQGGTGATSVEGAVRNLTTVRLAPDIKGSAFNFNDMNGDPGAGGLLRGCSDTGGAQNAPKNVRRTASLYSYGGLSSLSYFNNDGITSQMYISHLGDVAVRMKWGGGYNNDWQTLLSNSNTTIDANGFVKVASPIIKLKGDGTAELNAESEGVIVERIDVGVYRISGVLGFNSDPTWGGIDGGIVIPHNSNGLALLWVDSKVESNGDIIIHTYHRTHSNVPSFASNLIGIKNDDGSFTETVKEAEPVDIPQGRWIDLRVEMPSDSVYNLKLEEMKKQAEEAIKLAEEEEKRKQEELANSADETSEPEKK